jgi:hypothetical protein
MKGWGEMEREEGGRRRNREGETAKNGTAFLASVL